MLMHELIKKLFSKLVKKALIIMKNNLGLPVKHQIAFNVQMQYLI